ncbi:hypothetical protein Vretimale_9901, partial [Volvox reticuliferus]
PPAAAAAAGTDVVLAIALEPLHACRLASGCGAAAAEPISQGCCAAPPPATFRHDRKNADRLDTGPPPPPACDPSASLPTAMPVLRRGRCCERPPPPCNTGWQVSIKSNPNGSETSSRSTSHVTTLRHSSGPPTPSSK